MFHFPSNAATEFPNLELFNPWLFNDYYYCSLDCLMIIIIVLNYHLMPAILTTPVTFVRQNNIILA